MKFTIPQPLQHEHEALHERLRQATQAGGDVGEAAKTLARLMHPHFVKEDQIALPPLGLLAALARGEWSAEMAEVLTLTEQLEAELPQMLAEHQTIVAALNKLRDAAARACRSEIVAFAEALVEHARTELAQRFAALEQRRDRLPLDRRRLLVTEFGEDLGCGGGKSEVEEGLAHAPRVTARSWRSSKPTTRRDART